jgi:phage shock protein A
MFSLILFLLLAATSVYALSQLNDPKSLAKFKKIFRIGGNKNNQELDAADSNDPVKLAEGNIAELKKDLHESQRSLAEIKALTIRTQKEKDVAERNCQELEERAFQMLQKGKSGEIPMAEAEKRAVALLDQREKIMANVRVAAESVKHYRAMLEKLEANNAKIYEQVSEWENELKTLKARNRMNEASKKMHERLTKMDDSNTQHLIDKMRQNAEEQEAISQAYQELTQPYKSKDEDEVDRILGYKSAGALENLKRLKSLLEETPVIPNAENKTSNPESKEQKPTDVNNEKNRFEIINESKDHQPHSADETLVLKKPAPDSDENASKPEVKPKPHADPDLNLGM